MTVTYSSLHGYAVGDRVIAVRDASGYHTDGIPGTVLCFDLSLIGVEFDENIHGHECDGSGKRGHCLWVTTDEIVPYEDVALPELVGSLTELLT